MMTLFRIVAIDQVVALKLIQDAVGALVAMQRTHGAHHMAVAMMLLVVRCKVGDSELGGIKHIQDLRNQCFHRTLLARVGMRLLDRYIRLE